MSVSYHMLSGVQWFSETNLSELQHDQLTTCDKRSNPLWTDPAGPLSRPACRPLVYKLSRADAWACTKCTIETQLSFAKRDLKTLDSLTSNQNKRFATKCWLRVVSHSYKESYEAYFSFFCSPLRPKSADYKF